LILLQLVSFIRKYICCSFLEVFCPSAIIWIHGSIDSFRFYWKWIQDWWFRTICVGDRG
jgi:hypothetical protein